MEFYQGKETNILRRAISWIVDITVALSLAWFFLFAFGTQIKVTGQSMVPLLQPDEVVLINRLLYDYKKPDRMDVVVFKRENQKTNVKRIIGLPGETIQIIDGYIYIDGEHLVVGYNLDQVSLGGLAEKPVELGKDEYFLLGDNRDSSEDSRFVNVGNVRKDQIIGKVWLRVFPLIRFNLIFS